MKPPRVTIRSLMLVVLVAALTTWGFMLWRRSAQFAAKADKHIGKWYLYDEEFNIIIYKFVRHNIPLSASEKVEAGNILLRMKYEQRMYQKYRRAMYFPWTSVVADPEPAVGR